MKITLLLLLSGLFSLTSAQYFKITPHAHSHNDYLKSEPLWGALNNGCQSVEVDVFNFKNELVVSHVGFGLMYKPSFAELYLDTLVSFLGAHKHIFSQENEPLILMIDFKTESESTLKLLLKTFAPYQEYFSYFENGKVVEKQIKLVISGSGFSYTQVKDLPKCFVFLDGGVQHCEQDFPLGLVPRGSTRYGGMFTWNGKGEIPSNELAALRNMVNEAKNCNKKLRFYAMPQNKNIWRIFLEEGVYWINVDDTEKFKKFYYNEYKKGAH